MTYVDAALAPLRKTAQLAAAGARVVAVEHEMGGRHLKPGERVYAWMNAANRDPRRFPDPDRFDIQWHRHTGEWFCLYRSLTLAEAIDTLGSEGLFHPH